MLSEENVIVQMIEPADNQAGGIDSESINMGHLNSVTILRLGGAITGDGEVIKFYAGASSGTKTTEVPFHYRLSGADFKASNNDQFGARTAIAAGGSGLTMTAAAYDHRVVEMEVLASDMPDGEPWLTIDYDDGSASGLLTAFVAIGEPRYEGLNSPTVVA